MRGVQLQEAYARANPPHSDLAAGRQVQLRLRLGVADGRSDEGGVARGTLRAAVHRGVATAAQAEDTALLAAALCTGGKGRVGGEGGRWRASQKMPLFGWEVEGRPQGGWWKTKP